MCDLQPRSLLPRPPLRLFEVCPGLQGFRLEVSIQSFGSRYRFRVSALRFSGLELMTLKVQGRASFEGLGFRSFRGCLLTFLEKFVFKVKGA